MITNSRFGFLWLGLKLWFVVHVHHEVERTMARQQFAIADGLRMVIGSNDRGGFLRIVSVSIVLMRLCCAVRSERHSGEVLLIFPDGLGIVMGSNDRVGFL